MQAVHTIPIIDLADYLSDDPKKKSQFIQQVGEALRDVGFFALTNHQIDKSLIEKSYALSEEFFALDETTKLKYEDLNLKGQRGYTSYGREHAKGVDAPDLKEYWHIGQDLPEDHYLREVYPDNMWPSEVPEFEPVFKSVYKNLESCALSVLEACSLFIGEDKNLMRDMAKNGNSILRLIHYPPIPEDANPASVRAAAHEDINFITLLIDATTSGLEILNRDGEWIPVVTPDDCIIVDSGDMIQNLTNGYYRATTHRVTNPDDSRQARFSMPFFLHARAEVSLAPLDSCIEKTGGKAVYPEITALDYLYQRLEEIGLKA